MLRKFLSLSLLNAKKPLETSSGFPKMERAKRLELNAGRSETAEQTTVVNSANTTDTQLSTHAAEVVEIGAAWPRLSREIQTAVLTLVRVGSKNTG